MYKRALVLSLIFLFVVLLSLMTINALVFFVVLGLSLCTYAKFTAKPRDSFILLSGLAILSAALAVVLLIVALKAWLLSGQ